MQQTSRVRRHAKHGTHGVFGIVAALALCRGAPATDRCHPGGAETDDRRHHRGYASILPQEGPGAGCRVDHPARVRTSGKESCPQERRACPCGTIALAAIPARPAGRDGQRRGALHVKGTKT